MDKLPVISVLVLIFVGVSSGSILNSSIDQPGNDSSAEVLMLEDNETADVDFTMVNTTSYEVETGVIASSYSNNSLNITGHILVATPCRDLEHNLTQTGDNSYRLDITSVEAMGSCVQVQAYTRYNADIQGERPLDLEVTHDGETVSTLEDPMQEKETEVEEKTSLFDNIMSYLSQLFR